MDSMDFRRQDEEEDSDNPPPPAAAAAPPPIIRESAFVRPMLSPSSSLLSPRGAGAGGGVARNDEIGSVSTNPTASSSRAMDSSAGALRYRECLRNHFASLGGHVLDGCCEFMPSSTDDAFKCAACGCHRSFHRIDGDHSPSSHSNPNSLYHLHDTHAQGRFPLLLPPLHPHHHHPPPPTSHHHHQKQFISPAILELRSSNSTGGGGGGGGTMTESSSEERNAGAGPPQQPYMVSRKRSRTKFTTEQKERMLDFAERVGWRIQKQDEALVEEFCAEVGVSRQVLKVWMHNNKHSIRKQQQQQQQEHQDM